MDTSFASRLRGPEFTRLFTSKTLSLWRWPLSSRPRPCLARGRNGRLWLTLDLRPEALPRGRSDKLLRLRLRVESEPSEKSRSALDHDDPRPPFHAVPKGRLRDEPFRRIRILARACATHAFLACRERPHERLPCHFVDDRPANGQRWCEAEPATVSFLRTRDRRSTPRNPVGIPATESARGATSLAPRNG